MPHFVQIQVAQNTFQIAQNTFQIVQNTFHIAQNTLLIAQNTFLIAQNTFQIAQNIFQIAQNTFQIAQKIFLIAQNTFKFFSIITWELYLSWQQMITCGSHYLGTCYTSHNYCNDEKNCKLLTFAPSYLRDH